MIGAICLQVASVVSNSATRWTLAHQAPLSMGFSRQEYWNGLPCSPPEDLPDPGMETSSLTSPALAGKFFTISATWEAPGKHASSLFGRGTKPAPPRVRPPPPPQSGYWAYRRYFRECCLLDWLIIYSTYLSTASVS